MAFTGRAAYFRLMPVLTLLTTGFLTGVGLIIAIGPQNAFVLRQGIRRERVAVVVLVCVVADVALIALGTAGIGIVFEHAPWIVEIMRWGGVVYLVWFAWTSIRSAFGGPEALTTTASGATAQDKPSAVSVAAATAALTFLNPHVYLDTVVMLGTVANQHELRWVFSGGAMLGSLVWFAALGWGAHLLAPSLRSPRVWRVIDVAIAAVMLMIAAKLAFA
ncbi:L-lysine exporter family protein LysE/ArgO [Brevibacterium sp. Mu109]|uniref:Transporter, LysE family n=2 Tax=Brevibacteriaceae TaxID=85019 RepID=A0A1X6XE35_9MICO|nr:Transporter, LysE family [Brevibacterium yomogidense]SMX64490.1 L-lysine exporter family protein LysE/ArgO [Brevibacterium sp. Mu109]